MFNALELKIPPVPLAGVFIALAWLLATLLPALHVEWPWRGPVGAVLAATGVTIAIAGVISFRKARTTVNPLRPGEATTLVASGIYRWTRNPMYLGLLLLLAGCVWFLGNAAGLLLLPLFVAYMNRFQIGPEERALRQRFGDGFDVYQRSTRRWL